MAVKENPAPLNAKEQSMVKISALTAIGNMNDLKIELATGLEDGLTVNQINDLLAQLYAYCGFPRSLNAITTFMKLVEDRKQNGINDVEGEKPTTTTGGDRYELGRKTLETLTGQKQLKPAPGFGEFNPTVDRFLKEHLFGDIFESDLLSYKQRELVTIAALASMNGVEGQLQAHFGMGMNTGITEAQMLQLLDIVTTTTSSKIENNTPREAFLKHQVSSNTADYKVSETNLVRISEIKIYPEFFEEYIAILKIEAAASVEKEAGVIAIFPLVQKQDPSKVRLLEFYESQEAYKKHIQSEHFQTYKSTTLKMIEDLKLIDMYVVDAETMPLMFKKL